MARSHEEIRQLTEELERARKNIAQQSGILTEKLNVQKHATTLFQKYSAFWVTLAGVFGWLLSRLPARKKKIYILQTTGEKVTHKRSKTGTQGKTVGSHLWDLAWSIAKPAITAYFTAKLVPKKRG